MFNGHKNGNFAPYLVLAIGLCIIAFYSHVFPFSKGYQSANQDHQTAEKQYSISAKQEKACLRALTVSKAIECYKKAEKTDRDEYRAKQDLNAQREMADWAEGMLWATFVIGSITVLITAIGIYLLYQTLVATRDLLRQAEETTKAAKKSTQAAFTAVEVARLNAEREQRAYIVVKSATISSFMDHGKPSAKIIITNCGQTPALQLTARYLMQFGDEPVVSNIFFPKSNQDPSRINVAAGADNDIAIPGSNQVPTGGQSGVTNGTLGLYVAGIVTYMDIFKKRRFTTFKLCVDRRIIYSDGKGLLTACEKGNVSS